MPQQRIPAAVTADGAFGERVVANTGTDEGFPISPLPWANVVQDTGGDFDSGANTYTAPEDGEYLIDIAVGINRMDDPGTISAEFAETGSGDALLRGRFYEETDNFSSITASVAATGVVQLTAGTEYQVNVSTDFGGIARGASDAAETTLFIGKL